MREDVNHDGCGASESVSIGRTLVTASWDAFSRSLPDDTTDVGVSCHLRSNPISECSVADYSERLLRDRRAVARQGRAPSCARST